MEENGVRWRKPPTCLYNNIRRIEHKLRATSPLAIWERKREFVVAFRFCRVFPFEVFLCDWPTILWYLKIHIFLTHLNISCSFERHKHTYKIKRENKMGFILSRAYTFCISSNELFTDTHTYNLRFFFFCSCETGRNFILDDTFRLYSWPAVDKTFSFFSILYCLP
jgi:hypothetical protein